MKNIFDHFVQFVGSEGGAMINDAANGSPVGSGKGLPSVRVILPAFLTVPEVACRLRVSEKTVRRLVNRRHLPRCNHLGKVLIPSAAVEKWIIESTKI
jgi:excisionase family DNA binding protein